MFGIWLRRRTNDLSRRALLYDLSVMKHIGPAAKAADQREVMRDEQKRQSAFPPYLIQQTDDLCLYGHVQRRGCLVTNQQTRFLGDGPCDRGPLAFAAADPDIASKSVSSPTFSKSCFASDIRCARSGKRSSALSDFTQRRGGNRARLLKIILSRYAPQGAP